MDAFGRFHEEAERLVVLAGAQECCRQEEVSWKFTNEVTSLVTLEFKLPKSSLFTRAPLCTNLDMSNVHKGFYPRNV